MKRLLLFSGVVLFATVGRGQTAEQLDGVTSNEFQAQVQRELAEVPGGAELYRRCDAFSRKIDFLASRALALRSHESEGMLAQDTFVKGDISQSPADEDEPSIAINRRNTQLILGGANDMTMDRLPLANDQGAKPWGDPMIISDNSGTFYYSFLLYPIDGVGPTDLMVAHSNDGKTWTLGSPVVGNTIDSVGVEDKETIAIDGDLRSAYYGRLYIAWTEYRYDDGVAAWSATHLFAYSDNKGNSWSSPVQFTQTYGYFALLRVGERGTVFIASMTNDDSDAGMHGMSLSTDGGQSFTDVPIADFTNYPTNYSGRPGLKGNKGFRAIPYPSFDVDSANHINAVYGSYDVNNVDAAIYEVTSGDLGHSWSEPIQVGSPEGLDNDHYLPWVTTDPITQRTYLSMSSSEEDLVLNIKSRAVMCNYQTPNQFLDMGSILFNPTIVDASGNNFIGDYAGSDAFDGAYATSWTENRPTNHSDGEIFAFVSASISAYSPPSAVRQINRQEFEAGNFAPNPATGSMVSVTIASSDARTVSIRIFNLNGSEVMSSNAQVLPSDVNSITLNIHSLPAGVYHVVISSGANEINRNLLILR